jgi:glycosyltransferase involved in cell wall biosynthesis
MPVISVLMPVYNAEPYLDEAIQSILSQTFTDFEFIIINDGSTDKSKQIIQSYDDQRIKYFENEKNIGLVATLNKGIDICTGKYLARMDADDISLPERLKKLHDFMENNPEVGLCGTWFETFNKSGIVAVVKYKPDDFSIRFNHLYAIHISHGTCIIRLSVLIENNLRFDPEFAHAEDYDLWSRISDHCKMANIQEVLYKVRNNEQSVSVKFNSIQKSNSISVKKNLFKKIGCDVNENEIAVFSEIFLFEFSKISHLLSDTESLLKRLIESNNITGYFDRTRFSNYLGLGWFNICRYAAKDQNIFKAYKKSSLSKYGDINQTDKFKLLIKSLIA